MLSFFSLWSSATRTTPPRLTPDSEVGREAFIPMFIVCVAGFEFAAKGEGAGSYAARRNVAQLYARRAQFVFRFRPGGRSRNLSRAWLGAVRTRRFFAWHVSGWTPGGRKGTRPFRGQRLVEARF